MSNYAFAATDAQPVPDPPLRVAGHCPMGCGQTLFLGDGGHVTCSLLGCPNPGAADTLLHDTTEHVVTLLESSFVVRHPLRERVEDTMEDCPLHAELSACDGPPAQPGRYLASRRPVDGYSESYRSPGGLNGWTLEPIQEPARG